MMIKELFLSLCAVVVVLSTSSCASVPEKTTQLKTTRLESLEVARDNDDEDAVTPPYKSPFFDEEDEDTYYENEDEDDSRFYEWFIDELKGFWDFVTYPGRAIRSWKK